MAKPSLKDLVTRLSGHSAAELKALCQATGVKPAKSKDETIKRLIAGKS